jgi:MYXO-CTERM domain-containing protein
MSHDEAKRRVLARRARFIAAAGIAGATLSASTAARAEDAGVDDGGTDGAIFVEAGVRSDGGDGEDDLVDGAPPTPCLSMKKPEDPQPCLSSCAATPNPSSAPIAPAIVAAGAVVASLRRRKQKR